MPLYEYQCDECENRFERIQKFADPPIDKCPRCGGVVRKLISSPAIQFKGSGWYITDYARKAEKPGSDSAGKSEGGTAAAAPSGASESPDSSAGKTASPEKATAKEPAAAPKPSEKSTPGSKS